MAAPKWHMERLREILRREIGTAIAQDARDPRIPDIVTVTEVRLAKDTRNATVYVSVMGDDSEKRAALDALAGAAPFIQRAVASRVVVKNFPHLIFKLDTSIEYGQHINELFREIQGDLSHGDVGGGVDVDTDIDTGVDSKRNQNRREDAD